MDLNSLRNHKNHMEYKFIKFLNDCCTIEIALKKCPNNTIYILYETPARTSQRTQSMPITNTSG